MLSVFRQQHLLGRTPDITGPAWFGLASQEDITRGLMAFVSTRNPEVYGKPYPPRQARELACRAVIEAAD
jgi:hypothetical protein